MNTNTTLLGIAIPTYNRSEMLLNLVSTIPDSYEVYVSDNGGFTDVGRFGGRPNIVIDKTETVIPVFGNWNRAIAGVRSPYVAIPSDDDLYLENAITEIGQEIRQNPDVDVFIFGHHHIDEHNRVMSSWVPAGRRKFDPPFGFNVFKFGVEARMPCIVFRKSLLNRIGCFDETFKITAGDSDLVQRALIFGTSLFVPKVMACYRIWSGGSTSQTISSEAWLPEIDYWTRKIAVAAVPEFRRVQATFDQEQYVDEIYARNLMAGADNKMKTDGGKSARKYIFGNRFPSHSMLLTKMKLLKLIIRSFTYC